MNAISTFTYLHESSKQAGQDRAKPQAATFRSSSFLMEHFYLPFVVI